MQYISQKKKLIIQMNITNDEYQTCKDIQFFYICTNYIINTGFGGKKFKENCYNCSILLTVLHILI